MEDSCAGYESKQQRLFNECLDKLDITFAH